VENRREDSDEVNIKGPSIRLIRSLLRGPGKKRGKIFSAPSEIPPTILEGERVQKKGTRGHHIEKRKELREKSIPFIGTKEEPFLLSGSRKVIFLTYDPSSSLRDVDEEVNRALEERRKKFLANNLSGRGGG